MFEQRDESLSILFTWDRSQLRSLGCFLEIKTQCLPKADLDHQGEVHVAIVCESVLWTWTS